VRDSFAKSEFFGITISNKRRLNKPYIATPVLGLPVTTAIQANDKSVHERVWKKYSFLEFLHFAGTKYK